MAFDPNLVLSPDPAIRAKNSYEAALAFAQGQLSAANFTALETQLSTAGLPTTANVGDVLNLPNPYLYVSGVWQIVLRFVGGFPINPAAIAGALAGGAQVAGDVTVGGILNAAGGLQVAGNTTLTGGLTAPTGVLATQGNITASGSGLFTGGVRVGSLAVPAAGELNVQNAVEAARLVITTTTAFAGAPNGTLAEDPAGDIYYKTLAGRVVHLNRPAHDTGWISLDPAHGSIGVAGLPPTPAATPDIYGGTPWTFASAEPGSSGGPTRMVAWIRAKLLAGVLNAGGTYVYFMANSYQSGANQAGIGLSIDATTRYLSISVNSALIPAQPGITVGATGGGLIDVRVMAWIR